MKKDNEDKILRNNLSTLLKRFSKTDVISTLEKEYSQTIVQQIPLSLIMDNHLLKKAKMKQNAIDMRKEEISEQGINSPLFVIQNDVGYEIVTSRTSYYACCALKIETVPCICLTLPEEDELLFLLAHYRDMKEQPIVAMSIVLNALAKNYGFTQLKLAAFMHKSRSQITNIMRLTKLPKKILDDIATDKLSFGHVRAISTLNNDQIENLIEQIYQNHLSVRDVEIIVARMKSGDTGEIETHLSKKYQCQTKIRNKEIIFRFNNSEEKEEFINKIK